LLDEPLGALDRRLRDAMQVELKSLHRRLGITFVYVTHDQEEALSMADTLIVMRDGAVEQHGTPADVYDRPRTPWIARFVGECNVWEGDVVPITGGFEVRHIGTGAVLHRAGAKARPPGPRAAVAVRPEWLVVESEGATLTRERIQGRLVQERFRGSELLLECETIFGRALVRVHRRDPRATVRVSEDLVLSWSPERTVLLKGSA
jgi:ABC-type Fe3+/spermidine/putrescine transport system ATPase subunit